MLQQNPFSKITLIVFSFLLFGTVTAQDSLFLAKIGDNQGSESTESIIQNSKGNLIIAGSSDAFGGGDADAMLIEADLSGNVLWAKTYGGTSDDYIIDVKQTSDGGYIGVGITESFGAQSQDYWVVKTDSAGAVQWEKRYGGSGDDQAWSVSVDGNNYFVCGGSDSYGVGGTDLWALKLDATGDVLWQNAYGSGGEDANPGPFGEYVGRGVVNQNGRYAISGLSDSVGHGGTDIWLAQLDANSGSILWQFAYGDIDDEGAWSFSTSNSGYFLTGAYTVPSPYETDVWALEVDTTGSIAWQKTYGLAGDWDESLFTAPTSDGGVVMGAWYESGPDWVATMLKTDASGNLEWATEYDLNDYDWTNSVAELDDGTFALAGISTDTTNWDDDMLIARTDSMGSVSNCANISNMTLIENTTTTSRMSITMTRTATMDSGATVSSTVQSVTPNVNKICTEGMITSNEPVLTSIDQISVFPNPTSGSITFEVSQAQKFQLEILDATGKLMNRYHGGSNKLQIDVDSFASGLYFYRMEAIGMKNVYTGKFIVN